MSLEEEVMRTVTPSSWSVTTTLVWRRSGRTWCVPRAASLWSTGSQGVRIRWPSVHRRVRDGTDSTVVLDCDYVYNENDLKLVVKWFFNGGLEPGYQWIPEMKVREAFGVLQRRLDDTILVNFREDYSQYQAIRILKSTKELNREYTCIVPPPAGQDTRNHDMTALRELLSPSVGLRTQTYSTKYECLERTTSPIR
ncbi:hypothetical protein HPB48_000547 [Haemaphysalis longicornis]|uniref:Ig-like domain-containing protein n=1 Tax=Haemaphysalis longicornis TaxID=44386 RepID=A0A9J6G2K2_HAELO|nr:hypothetical protein HPB48_000547 [Haemaphysalis longicornis]